MKNNRVIKIYWFCLALLMALTAHAQSQQTIVINMAMIDGLPLTPDNIFNYQAHASAAGKVDVKGTIHYRNSNLNISYAFSCNLRQGVNTFPADEIHPQWQFSSTALQELFFTYKVLPEGTFEYCVTITPSTTIKENQGGVSDECLYHRSDDIFLINLVHPENNAKIEEYNPLLSWVANYSFATELTYRLRVAEIKEGQNAVNAVMRNQPMYDESNLMQSNMIYPIYAKPLVANKWYAWTVDAYYRGILLGGAETWRFIIQDSTAPEKEVSRSFIDVKRERGANKLYAIGRLKLKYVLDEAKNDELYLELSGQDGSQTKLTPSMLKANYGDNRYTLDLTKANHLKHKSLYVLKIRTKTNHEYRLPFQYINPEFNNE